MNCQQTDWKKKKKLANKSSDLWHRFIDLNQFKRNPDIVLMNFQRSQRAILYLFIFGGNNK